VTLHTIELSHEKPRLTAPRPSALGTVPTAGERSPDHDERGRFTRDNSAATERASKAGMRRPYRQARKRVREALASGVEPGAADVLLADAFGVYLAARREFGAGRTLTEGPAIAYGVETILAGYFTEQAALAGFLTDEGARLHDRALACEQAAARALTAGLAAAKALGCRRPGKTKVPSYLEAEGEAVE
jgi:hypothetical protein